MINCALHVDTSTTAIFAHSPLISDHIITATRLTLLRHAGLIVGQGVPLSVGESATLLDGRHEPKK
jgi:hypothetical protein